MPTMKVAKTSPEEIHRLLQVLNEVEWINDELRRNDLRHIDFEDYEVFGKKIRGGSPTRMLEDLIQYLSRIHFQRILTNCEVLLNACADPEKNVLEFHPDIAAGLAMLRQYRSEEPGRCLNETVVKVAHAKLERIGDSAHTSQCPKCDPGTLVMQRNAEMQLQPHDACLFCGQRFQYTDVVDGVLQPDED